ncbi:potassium channel family protein [Arcobacter porcinus]|uniref:Putative potassium channel protein (TrkA domain) n=1 Tax=Arcobacter porcinus TaxID=1935204 RepID=A0A1C0AV25_9BACT|nr:NAD-binding protein [Arcobacter porcinus]OCL96667.1 voltage-gated potassium channel [Aliarcobacter thereius]OCL83703.1 voltage-gated potassium channel [Arcobacter porcinus]OCL83937.1 voltage-gated potassium channel [Arcobacter porcinus]OCL85809.1 voltage-gated potassium channel [Arcobacter porcinus]OCL89922.1 voltage-gated potassium channel [Arcobacter porcinus]
MSIFTKIKKGLGWELTSSKPQYDLNPLLYSKLKPIRLPLILIQSLMIIGVLGYVYFEDYSIMHAIFQTSYTLTNTGFGALNESNFKNETILFTVFLMIAGFTSLIFAVGVVIDVFTNGNLRALLKERKMLYKIARLRKHFVLFYHNEYTAQVAKQFRENHIPFVVVDPSDDIENIAKEHGYPYFVKDEPHKETSFLKSHLSSAKGAISLSKNISDNITLIASVRLYEKELERSPFLIISNAETQNEKIRLKKLGADKVVATPSLMAKRVSAMAISPDMENILDEFLYKKDSPITMEDFFIRDDAWIVGKELKELDLREKLKISVIGITEENGVFIHLPKGDKVINKNSKLLIVGSQKGIVRAKRVLNLINEPREI